MVVPNRAAAGEVGDSEQGGQSGTLQFFRGLVASFRASESNSAAEKTITHPAETRALLVQMQESDVENEKG